MVVNIGLLAAVGGTPIGTVSPQPGLAQPL